MTDEQDGTIGTSDIAVIGTACRFPGARNPGELWRNVRASVESIETYSEQALLEAGVPETLVRDPRYVRVGAPLPQMEMFDAGFFGLGPQDAAIMDPQHRHFLEVCWEALEDAACVPATFDGSIGVFAGCGMQSYMARNLLPNEELLESVGLFLIRHTGNDKDFLATRVSYCLDLRGPSVNVQTACSTSLVAVHSACQSLLGGDCDVALAGGVSIEVPHRQGYLYRPNEILSPDGHCRAFDAQSRGTVFSSGAGVVVLRRLEDALADGDPIQARIRASAINNDGANKVGYLAPSVDGQAEVVAEALAFADIDPRSIGYVEAHGTGTAVGDPIEIAALTEAFRTRTDETGFCAVGSIKTNIGHTDQAAGVAGLIKTIEALRHREIPPMVGCTAPSPLIDFENSPFYPSADLAPWSGGPRRAGVSSLGVGGTNAHVILEEAPVAPEPGPDKPWQLLLWSGKSRSAVQGTIDRFGEFFGQSDRDDAHAALADVAYTLQVGRHHFSERAALVCRDLEELPARLAEQGDPADWVRDTANARQPQAIFCFPGGGAQYPDMGLGLYQDEPVYRDALDRCLGHTKAIAGIDLEPILHPRGADLDRAAQALERPTLTLASLFSVEYALAELWMSLGVRPAAMTGHSMGEYVAACLAGVFSLEDALRIVLLRGDIFERAPRGVMLSVMAGEDRVGELVDERLSIAAVNAADLTTVAGDMDAIEALEQRLGEQEIAHRRIKIDVAAHSLLLDPFLDEFRSGVAALSLHAPTIPFVSNCTGRWIEDAEAVDPEYWVRHLREPVRFADGLTTLLAIEPAVLMEVGPGSTLGSLVRMHPGRGRAHQVVASLRHPQEDLSDRQVLLRSVGRMWTAGVAFDWSALHADALPGERRRLRLPTYAFDHKRYWIDAAPPSRSNADAGKLARKPSADDWFYRARLTERPLPAQVDERTAKRWLVFLDRAGVGDRLVSQLVQQGDTVVTVGEGDGFHRLGEGRYRLDPDVGAEGYEALFGELSERDAMPDRIVHMWGLTPDATHRRASNPFHDLQERGFYSLLYIIRAQAKFDPETGTDARPIQLDYVSNGMQSIGGEAPPEPAKALALGPLRVLPREFPALSCRAVDIELPGQSGSGRKSRRDRAALDALSRQLQAELVAEETGEIAYRGGRRFVLGYEKSSLPAPVEGIELRDRGVYVVTGGLGGVGLLVAEHLARTARACLVLIGRSELPERSRWDEWLASHSEHDPTAERIRAVRELEALGADVMVASGDIANIERAREIVDMTRSRFGDIHGVFHAAGVLDEGLVLAKTRDAIESVLAPKVQGTLVLQEVLGDRPLDFMALFSSTSAILGPPGQADYCAASCFLDAFAARGELPSGGRILSIDWGTWSDVGMAVRLREQMRRGDSRFREAIRVEGRALLDERLLGVGRGVEGFGVRLSADRWVLDEHRLRGGPPVLPGTAYLELACEALDELEGRLAAGGCELRDVSFVSPLTLTNDAPRDARILFRRDGEALAFEVESRDESSAWVLHCRGQAVASAEPVERSPEMDLDAIRARCAGAPSSAELHPDQAVHLEFGRRWQVLREAQLGDGEALALLELPREYASDLERCALHPALVDMATAFALRLRDGYRPEDGLFVPSGYRRLRVYGALPSRVASHARLVEVAGGDPDSVCFDVRIADRDGRVLMDVEGFTMRRLPQAPIRAEAAEMAVASASQSLFQETLEAGIRRHEGMLALDRILESGARGAVIVSPIDLPEWFERLADAAARPTDPGIRFARPELETEYAEPRDEIESALASDWQELLGVDQVGVDDDFFELGGHSLIAVRLFGRIQQRYGVEYPLSLLFETPTVAGCAARIRADTERSPAARDARDREPRFEFLVPLRNGGGSGAPIFVVAGMLGNVLNLRHLAALMGDDQAVYGLQARGLYGDAPPHTRFDEMAKHYLGELRTVQPEGPYYLAGFSGGGIIAYEMAQQLVADGEHVAILAMLDTPAKVPALRWTDRLKIQWLKLRDRGAPYLFEFMEQRFAWERDRLRAFLSRDDEAETSPATFRSSKIQAAFMEALDHYAPKPYAGRISLFRPELDEAYVLGAGRVANRDLVWVREDNHWSPLAADGVEVHVVPGSHNGMVLEPHVRVLAGKMRNAIAAARERLERPVVGD